MKRLITVAYFLTYNSVHSLAYLPYDDEVMQSDYVIDLSEMPALFEQVTGFKAKE